jgi:hypothetical protein
MYYLPFLISTKTKKTFTKNKLVKVLLTTVVANKAESGMLCNDDLVVKATPL